MHRAVAYKLVMDMRANGMSNKQIADSLGRKIRWVTSVLDDPDGTKQKNRRERYRGVCEDCGKKTDGSSGYNAPAVCVSCNGKRARLWTREAIISAIQVWAEEHGRPPRAGRDWKHAEKGKHPSATSAYRSSNHYAPFDSWADAIEAAGFPRPLVGVYGERESWNKERIIEAMQRWVAEHDKVPTMKDWRLAERGRPTSAAVVFHFGRWSNAVEAAGFTRPRAKGGNYGK